MADPAPTEQARPAASDDGITEITVTAQRRNENLQDVPIAITVADAAVLAEARVFNIENINMLSPSISFHMADDPATTGNIQIRGLGTTGLSKAFEGGVGVFIDGVYRTRSGEALENFLDVDTVQILRGPQDTLYGKDTSAGAILINSKAPSLMGSAATSNERREFRLSSRRGRDQRSYIRQRRDPDRRSGGQSRGVLSGSQWR
ncbi:MAG: TonB-dependent receptor plug domain-containing protein [Aliidongia sp.]